MRLRPTAASSPVVRYQQNCTVQHNKGLAPLSPYNSKHQPAREKVPAVPIRRDLQSHCHFPGDNYYSGRPAMYPEIRGAKARAKTRPTYLFVCQKRDTSSPQKNPPPKKESFARKEKVPGRETRTQMRPATVRLDLAYPCSIGTDPEARGSPTMQWGEKRKKKKSPLNKIF